MARRLRAPAEDQSLIPSMHTVLPTTTCYSSFRGFDAIVWPLRASGFSCTYFYTDELYIVKNKMYLLKTLEDKLSDYFLNPCLRKCFLGVILKSKLIFKT